MAVDKKIFFLGFSNSLRFLLYKHLFRKLNFLFKKCVLKRFIIFINLFLLNKSLHKKKSIMVTHRALFRRSNICSNKLKRQSSGLRHAET